MLQSILEILAEFGLLREDFKHHKKITEKEKQDGKKRPFQRYFLQPSSIMAAAFLILGGISFFMFLIYQYKAVYPEKTHEELSEMSDWIEKWNEKFGKYPESLDEMIGTNPLHQHWDSDAWNRPYKYVVTADGKSFLLLSSGLDGQFETEDDIKSE